MAHGVAVIFQIRLNQFAPVNPIAIPTLTTNKNTRRQFLGGLSRTVNILPDSILKLHLIPILVIQILPIFSLLTRLDGLLMQRASLQNGTSQNTYWNWNQIA